MIHLPFQHVGSCADSVEQQDIGVREREVCVREREIPYIQNSLTEVMRASEGKCLLFICQTDHGHVLFLTRVYEEEENSVQVGGDGRIKRKKSS